MKHLKFISLGLLAILALAVCLTVAIAGPYYPYASGMQDAGLRVSAALPAANATNDTASIDLGFTNPVVVWKHAFLLVSLPACTNATNTSVNYSFTLQDSADNSSFTATTPLIQGQLPGVGGGTAATNYWIPLPPTVRRYIRIEQGVPANGGANTTVTNVCAIVIP